MIAGLLISLAVLAVVVVACEKDDDNLNPPPFTLDYVQCEAPRVALQDCQNPYSADCVSGGVKMDARTPTPVFPNSTTQKEVGTLTLMLSAQCETAWARVAGIRDKNAVFRILLTREKLRNRAHFDAALEDAKIPAVFGNMLSYEPGCVYAEAQVEGGPVARTPCVGK